MADEAGDPRGCGGERAQQAGEVLHVMPRRHVAGVACFQLVVQALHQGRPLPVAGQRGLGVSPQQSGFRRTLGTSVPARPRPWPLRECGSRPREFLQRRVLQGPGVGVLAGVQNRPGKSGL